MNLVGRFQGYLVFCLPKKLYKLIYSSPMKKLLVSIFIFIVGVGIFSHDTLIRLYQGAAVYFHSKNHLGYYQLKHNHHIEDITESLKSDPQIPLKLRQPLLDGKRRIYIFKYLSDGNEVAGYLSLLTQGEHPAIIFLRGGNGKFGILRPNNTFSYIDGYNVIGTLYRGNLYKGADEFGGNDINDIENLIKFLPQLEQYTNKQLKPPFSMIGVSRGAMQMLVSLSRSNLVKNNVETAVSISGNVDLSTTAKLRPEMKYMFEKKFNAQNRFNDFQSWLNYRNPVSLINQLNPSLNVLMLYGLKDNRVSIEEQHNLYSALRKTVRKVEFIKLPDAGHGMDEHLDEVKQMVVKFLSNKQ